MIRNITCALVALVAVMTVGCNRNDTPDTVVAKCWTLLSTGEIDKAVELMEVVPSDADIYREMFATQTERLQKAGGIEHITINSCDQGPGDARVEATVHLGNQNQITATYKLIKVGKSWKIKN